MQQNSSTVMYGGKDLISCYRLKTHGPTTKLSKNHQEMTKCEDPQEQDRESRSKKAKKSTGRHIILSSR